MDPAKQTIPIERLLAEYGKSHLQLTVAEETIQRQQSQISAIAKQFQDALAKLALRNNFIEEHGLTEELKAAEKAISEKPVGAGQGQQKQPTKISEIRLPDAAQEATAG